MDVLLGVSLISLFWFILFSVSGNLAYKKFDSVTAEGLCYGFAIATFLAFVVVSSAYVLRLLVS